MRSPTLRRALAIIILPTLAILACAAPGWVATAEPVSHVTETAVNRSASPTLSPAPKLPTLAITKTPPWFAAVKLPIVNVRSAPCDKTGETCGTIVGNLEAGDLVVIANCGATGSEHENWCEITEPVEGYVFRGCLSDNPDGLGCEAR